MEYPGDKLTLTFSPVSVFLFFDITYCLKVLKQRHPFGHLGGQEVLEIGPRASYVKRGGSNME